MEMLTYKGATPGEAIEKARAEYGSSVMIVSTKEIRKKTLSHPAEYEVAVAINLDDFQKASDSLLQSNPSLDASTPQKLVNNNGAEDVLLKISQAAKQISKVANVDMTAPKPHQSNNTTSVKDSIDKAIKAKSVASSEVGADIKEIKNRVNELNNKVKMIENMVWDVDLDNRGHLDIPPEFAEIYRLSKNSGVSKEHLDTIMKLTLENMPLPMRGQPIAVKRYFQEVLKKLIPSRIETELNGANKKIMMFVGPTGVGKTTTLAKLAARYSFLKKKKYQVGIITLDTFRIGAVEQLMQYAKMMKLGIESVEDPVDFSRAINSLKHCDYILIDTAGSSQNDHEKIDKLKQFLDYEPNTSIDVSLVLSANTEYEDLRDIYKNFSVLNIDTIIATKFDEAKGFGNIFSLIYENKKPLNYFSIGQEVPDDLLPATADFFTQCLLEGFKRSEQ